MAREQVEFIQSQRLPWQAAGIDTLGDGVDAKRLSEDTETGALSALLRYPAGYEQPEMILGTDEEFLVLEGELEIGGRRFGPYAYAHWPKGYSTPVRRSAGGAVVLSFYSATPAAGKTDDFDPERLVEYCDAFEVPYTGNFHPEFPPGAGRKLLYQDPATGDTTWILGTMPMRWAERSEVHTSVEEMYLLSGESHGDRGVMRPGAYFWRPPALPHGPYGTLTGNLYFFRTKGGPLQTEYVDPDKAFRWWPEYEPRLPAAMQPYAGEVERLTRCW